jgi:thiosulfate reductase cytochrome b subunit
MNEQVDIQIVQPLWLRLTHWFNVLAVVVMVLSGWRIYNASPLFDWVFPREATLGGWLGGALQWHFAAMWLLGFNGLAYLALNLITGRGRQRFWPLSARAVLGDAWSALHGRLNHEDAAHYNAVQKLAYLFAVTDLLVLVMSGLVLWKSVQFPVLRGWMGGYDGARLVHFIAMALLLAFVVVHLSMVALVPRTLRIMLRGH